MHIYVNIGLGAHTDGHRCDEASAAGDNRVEVKLGDGKLLRAAIKWAPVILALFGVKLPPLPDLEFIDQDVKREHVTGE